jgi:hypothetical protein
MTADQVRQRRERWERNGRDLPPAAARRLSREAVARQRRIALAAFEVAWTGEGPLDPVPAEDQGAVAAKIQEWGDAFDEWFGPWADPVAPLDGPEPF